MKLRFPRVTVPAGTSPELCFFVRLPTTNSFDVAAWELRVRGVRGSFGVTHFLVYLYMGERLAEFSQDAGRVISSRACLDLGPVDRDRRQLIASGAGPRIRGFLPAGVPLRLGPVPGAPGEESSGIGILLDINWVNGTDRARAGSAVVTLRRARKKTVRRTASPLSARSAELGLLVLPFERGSTEVSTAALNELRPGEPPIRDAWGPGLAGTPDGDVCLLTVSGQMHKRGRFLGVDLLDANGQVQSPNPGIPNPFETDRRHLFGAFDYTDPGVLRFQPPLLLRAGESLRYACWIDNGVSTTARLGCEERVGEPPGLAEGLPGGGGSAKPCTAAASNSPECPPTDARYPGRTFTGVCVPASIVAGMTPEDEVCGLTGTYYDAVPGAPSGAECDVSTVPQSAP